MKLQTISAIGLLAALALDPAASAQTAPKSEVFAHVDESKSIYFSGFNNPGDRLSLDGAKLSISPRGAGYRSVVPRPAPEKRGALAFVRKAAQRFAEDLQVAQLGDFKIKVRVDLK